MIGKLLIVASLFTGGALLAAEPGPAPEAAGTSQPAAEQDGTSQQATEQDSSGQARPVDPPGLARLDPRFPVWLDPKGKRVVMVGQICLRRGQLELFACLRGSKEHESIVSVPAEALDIHAALLALGAEPGNPARFNLAPAEPVSPDEPGAESGKPVRAPAEFEPARGTEIEVTVFWTDDKGIRRKARAQDWLRRSWPYYRSPDEDPLTASANMASAWAEVLEPVTYPWVFGGSTFWVDEQTGERYYQAEQGDFICVSNFTTAMLDFPIASSAEAGSLLFEAFTPRIPPLGTKVTLVLTPKQ
ncbi:MAG: YdjY domain-containing protein [Pirellulales bacterium]